MNELTIQLLVMPRRCVAAGCDSVSGKGCSFHKFPKNEALRRRWVNAVKRQRSNWNGPSADSQLCSNHFTEDCFVTDGFRFREAMGIKTLKRLKPDAVPTVFARSIDYLQASSSQSTTTLAGRPLSKRRQQRMVRAQVKAMVANNINTQCITKIIGCG